MKLKKSIMQLIIIYCMVFAFSLSAHAEWRETNAGRRYYTSSNSYYKNCFRKINDKWYHFDKNGYQNLGRFEVNGKWYYSKKLNGIIKNTKKGYYYYDSKGVMVKNTWVTVDKHQYYFGSTGRMMTYRFSINGKYYYCDKFNGKVTNKVVNGYYYDKYGVGVFSKWVKIDGHYFYFGVKGNKRTGRIRVGGKYYYCKSSTGRVTNQWVNKHYYGADGAMAVNQWIGKSYVDANGDIIKGEMDPKNEPPASDVRLLAALVYYEAGNQSYYGKQCVASVVINRMKSSQFPNSLRGVIYQEGQFTPAMNGSVDYLVNSGKTIQAESVKAAKYVLMNGSVLKGYLYFNNYSGTKKIGDHYFS